MSIWDLISFLITTEEINTIIGSVTGGLVAIVGAIGALMVRKENNKRRDNCANPECCITGRKLKKKTPKSKANDKPKK